MDSLDDLFHAEKYKNRDLAFRYLDTIYTMAISVQDTYRWTRLLLNKSGIVEDSIKQILSDSLDKLFIGRKKDDIFYYRQLFKAIDIHKKKNYKTAIDKYLGIYEKLDTSIKKDLNLRTRLLTNLASAERSLGNYENAINYLNKGIELNEYYPKKIKKATKIANLNGLYNGLGLIFRRIQKYEEAYSWFGKCLDLLDPNDSRRIIPLLNTVNVTMHQGNYNKADSLSNELFTFFDKMTTKDKLNYYFDKARIAIKLENFIETKICIKKLKEFKTNLHQQQILASLEAQYFYFTNQYKDAYTLYEKYINLLPEESINSRIGAYNKYIKSYLGIHNNALLLTSNLLDSLNAENYKKNLESGIQEWEVMYETQQKENEIAQLKQENEINALSLKVNKLWIALLGGFLILMTGLLYFFRKSLEQQKVANQFLDSQKQQLQNQNTSLLEKIGTWEQAKSTFFTIPGKENRKVRFDDIIYISSDGNEVVFHTPQKKHRAWLRLKDLESELPNEHFVRSHRSFLINIHHASFENAKYILMSNGEMVGLSKSYKDNVEKILKK